MPAASAESSLPAGARSGCPIANALDLLGDKWTLLVIRDLLLGGKRRFGELLAGPEKIPTNLLTDRLRRLEENGLVVKVPYESRPQRFEYHPTPKGADLVPVLAALAEWSGRHVPGTFKPTPAMRERAEAAMRDTAAARDGTG
jgi:DNA-binding HxlR family transcriptional regulator